MNAAEVDRALADWKVRLQRVDDNLIALEVDPVCQLLEKSGADGLEGVTRQRVAPALAAMRELFAQRSLLDDVLQRAADLRKDVGHIFGGDHLREIDALLNGPSITMPPVETPLARRGLLDAASTTTSITPGQLLSAMERAFAEARDVVAQVDTAWKHLTPEIDRLRGVAPAAAKARLDDLTRAAARDPLGDVARRVTALGRQVATIAEAHDLMDRLRAARDAAAAADRRATAEVVGRDRPRPPAGGEVDGLAQWLATLDGTADADAVGVGLARWLEDARAMLAAHQAAQDAADAALATRDELAGRLGARQQQARALAARGAPLPEDVDALEAEAGRLLGLRPCPIEDAERAVRAFEAALRGGQIPHGKT